MLYIFTGIIVTMPVFSIFICDSCGMKNFDIHFTGTNKPLRMIFVRGTQGYTVTQTLVDFVMGRNSDKPAVM